MKRVALVTGGTRGIGFGIASALARKGLDLVLCGVRESSAVSETISKLQADGIQAAYFRADISQRNERERLIESIRRRFGHLEVLVNNAGVAPKERKDLLEATEESFEWVMKVNLQGPYFLTQSVANWMIEQKKGSPDLDFTIVNISSISATVASTNRGEYCLSKAGLAMATKLWAVRLAEFDIPVVELRPGLIKTDMTSGVKKKYDDLIEDGLLLQPRWGTPDDIGKAVASLVSGDFPYTTGEYIMLDGGMTVSRL
jgi:NAD(P)-dependent dehydrogenase (short-subunit alcohol dehydrogenase family)